MMAYAANDTMSKTRTRRTKTEVARFVSTRRPRRTHVRVLDANVSPYPEIDALWNRTRESIVGTTPCTLLSVTMTSSMVSVIDEGTVSFQIF